MSTAASEVNEQYHVIGPPTYIMATEQQQKEPNPIVFFDISIGVRNVHVYKLCYGRVSLLGVFL